MACRGHAGPTVVRAPLAGSCRPARVIIYAQTDWLRVATEFAANSSPCAQYYISVPPLAADKTQPRSGQAAQIRALGANFHALDEVNYTGWSSWVSAGSGSWFDAGLTARQRMAAAGFDVTMGDGWMLNELSSAVRKDTGAARADALAFMHGLADDGVKGVVATAGVSQSTADLSQYKVNLQDWLEDGGFWAEAAGYVSDWAQENYGDVRDYAVDGSTAASRAAAMVQYLGHESALAAAAPPVVGAQADGLLSATYVPFGNAAWAWSDSYGWTAVPLATMEDFVSGQVYADRSLGASTGAAVDRIGFAWAPSNTLGLGSSEFNNETKAVLDRIAAAVHDTDTGDDPAGAAACLPSWCTTALAGAAFSGSWQSFSTWSPQLPVITSAALDHDGDVRRAGGRSARDARLPRRCRLGAHDHVDFQLGVRWVRHRSSRPLVILPRASGRGRDVGRELLLRRSRPGRRRSPPRLTTDRRPPSKRTSARHSRSRHRRRPPHSRHPQHLQPRPLRRSSPHRHHANQPPRWSSTSPRSRPDGSPGTSSCRCASVPALVQPRTHVSSYASAEGRPRLRSRPERPTRAASRPGGACGCSAPVATPRRLPSDAEDRAPPSLGGWSPRE